MDIAAYRACHCGTAYTYRCEICGVTTCTQCMVYLSRYTNKRALATLRAYILTVVQVDYNLDLESDFVRSKKNWSLCRDCWEDV